jgi:hypothetical protein
VSVVLVHAKTGAVADPVLVDRKTGHALSTPDYVVTPGPAAGEAIRRKLASSTWGRAHDGQVPQSPFERRVIPKSKVR